MLLMFNVTEEVEKPKGDEIFEEEKSYQMQVYLDETIIEETSPLGTCIWDFADRKIISSNGQSPSFTHFSLFSDLGFRVYEFQNRIMMEGFLEASGIEENPMDHVLMEHLFSLTSKKATKLKRKKRNSRILFKHKDKELLKYSLKGESVEKEVKEQFLMFLRYRFGIHPKILLELEDLDSIPKKLVVYRYDVGKERFDLELVSKYDNAVRPTSEFTFVINSENNKLFELSEKVANSGEEDYLNACVSLKEKAIKNAEDKDSLNSMSLFLAYSLASGKQMPEEYFTFKEEMKKSKDVQLLLSAINPKSKEAIEKAVEDLELLSEAAEEGLPAILIFKANNLTSLGKHNAAIESFLAALSMEPMIVGAWKDIGDIYYENYDTEKAWLCWDAGRSLNKNHKLFREIDEFEYMLQREHPEFFLTESE